MKVRITSALAGAAAVAVMAGCSATAPHHPPTHNKTATAASAVTTAKACRDLASWENSSSASGSITSNTSLVNEIENVPNSGLSLDATEWINSIEAGNAGDEQTWASSVQSDCQQAGVPNVLNVGTPLVTTAPSPQVTDPSGNTCSSLDSQGYCPGHDPVTMIRQTDVVMFKVWGSGQPSIQYGTDSSTNNPGSLGPLGDGNALPWSATMPYDPNALYYAVTAQLEGSGSITDSVTEVIITKCSGKPPKTESFPLANGSASGGYGIAQAEYAGGDTGNALQAEADAGC